MKNLLNNMDLNSRLVSLLMVALLWACAGSLVAQEEEEAPAVATNKPVKNTFESVWLMDNQTVMVPIKGTFEMDIQHRFGTVKNGYDDLWGFYAPSNIRLGFSYAPIENLYAGFGLTKERLQWDFNLKYALLRQMRDGGMPVSVTYFGNMVVDGRGEENFVKGTDRLSYFHQILIARKVTDKFSLQVAPSMSFFNNVEGYRDSEGQIKGKMRHEHFALAAMGRYMVTSSMAVIVGLDQPLTQHPTNNPYPNISFGLEMSTSAHTFQVFAGNFSSITPQRNNVFNQKNFEDGEFLIGFNITRLWNF